MDPVGHHWIGAEIPRRYDGSNFVVTAGAFPNSSAVWFPCAGHGRDFDVLDCVFNRRDCGEFFWQTAAQQSIIEQQQAESDGEQVEKAVVASQRNQPHEKNERASRRQPHPPSAKNQEG